MALTFFLPTNPDANDEYVAEYSELAIGDLVGMGSRLKRFQVVAVYPYYPIDLGVEERVQLAIVHPIKYPVPPKEEWYCWATRYSSPSQTWHILKHDDEVLRVDEKPAGRLPAIGQSLADLWFTEKQPPKLDRASVAATAAKIQALPTGFELTSFTKHVSPDAPYDALYVVQTAKVAAKTLQLA